MNFPILSSIIFIPLIGALFIFITRGTQKNIEKNKGTFKFTRETSRKTGGG